MAKAGATGGVRKKITWVIADTRRYILYMLIFYLGMVFYSIRYSIIHIYIYMYLYI